MMHASVPTRHPLLLLDLADPHELGPAQGFFLVTDCFSQGFCNVSGDSLDCKRCYSQTISVLLKQWQPADDNHVLSLHSRLHANGTSRRDAT